MKNLFFATLFIFVLTLGNSSHCSPSDNSEICLQECEKIIQSLSEKEKQQLVQELLDAGSSLDANKMNLSPLLTEVILPAIGVGYACTICAIAVGGLTYMLITSIREIRNSQRQYDYEMV